VGIAQELITAREKAAWDRAGFIYKPNGLCVEIQHVLAKARAETTTDQLRTISVLSVPGQKLHRPLSLIFPISNKIFSIANNKRRTNEEDASRPRNLQDLNNGQLDGTLAGNLQTPDRTRWICIHDLELTVVSYSGP